MQHAGNMQVVVEGRILGMICVYVCVCVYVYVYVYVLCVCVS